MSESPPPARRRLRGDEAELFRLHFRRLVRQVQRDAGVPEAVAEDCASFAFLQPCGNQPERGAATGAWLRVVARHEAFAWLRQRRRLPVLEEEEEGWNRSTPGVERIPARLDVELAHEARELLRSIAALGTSRRTALTLRAAGYSYREIQQLLGVTYTWVNRHVTEGRQALRRAEAGADAEVEAAMREAA
jgi:RNA polymerase sigma factor (sigma-70 family)